MTTSFSSSSCFFNAQRLCAILRSHTTEPRTLVREYACSRECSLGCRGCSRDAETVLVSILALCSCDGTAHTETVVEPSSHSTRHNVCDCTTGTWERCDSVSAPRGWPSKDFLTSALPPTSSCSTCTLLHQWCCCHWRRVASERIVLPCHPNPWYGSAQGAAIFKFESPVRPARHLQTLPTAGAPPAAPRVEILR